MGWSDDDEFGWIVFFVSSWHHDRWWNQISITINSMFTNGLGVDGTGTRVGTDIVASSVPLVHGTVVATNTIFSLATSVATAGTAAKFTFEDAYLGAVGSANATFVGTTEYDFSSTTTAASATPIAAQNEVMGP